MAFFEARMSGADEIERALARLERRARGQVLGSATRAAAAVLRKEARRLAPRDTGVLRKAVAVRTNRRERNAVSLTMGLRPEGFHGIFAEFGTSTQEARPFMRPAFQAKSKDAVDAFRAKFWARLRLIAARQ